MLCDNVKLSNCFFGFAAALILVNQSSPAVAQHGPICPEVFPSEVEFRPDEIRLNESGLSLLPTIQKRNIAQYLREKSRRGVRAPHTIWVSKSTQASPSPNISIIFEDGPCASVCRGIAVVPGRNGVRFADFTYRKNYIYVPVIWRWKRVGKDYQMNSGRTIFLGPHESGFIVIYDVWRSSKLLSEDERNMKFVKISRSEFDRGVDTMRGFDYEACFGGHLERNAQLPLGP